MRPFEDCGDICVKQKLILEISHNIDHHFNIVFQNKSFCIMKQNTFNIVGGKPSLEKIYECMEKFLLLEKTLLENNLTTGLSKDIELDRFKIRIELPY